MFFRQINLSTESDLIIKYDLGLEVLHLGLEMSFMISGLHCVVVAQPTVIQVVSNKRFGRNVPTQIEVHRK